MTVEAGRLSQDLGPLTLHRGMDASSPEHALGPSNPENLFNLDMDRSGRAVPRPGSIHFARIGAGPVLGIYEHTFESGLENRKLVGVVHDPYLVLNNLASSADGTGQGGVGFCPDLATNGEPIIQFNGAVTDRFHIVSWLNRVYLAGSTIDNRVHEYDYVTGSFIALPQRGRSVVAQGNRLFIGGDPLAPNLLYPSDVDDPTVFNPALAFQVGTRNDAIVRLLEHDGLIVVLSERTASWVLAGDIAAGDVQVDDVSQEHGCVGALAAAEGGDGWVYWLSKTDGPVRWRRGAQLDRSYAVNIVELWETIEQGQNDFSSAVVQWDPVARCMRFEVPTGDATTPNYLLSYFVDDQSWTHGANTGDSTLATQVRSHEVIETAMGDPRYSALTSRRDDQDGLDKMYGGDADGHVWAWKAESVDKIRSLTPGEEGTDFICLARWGNIEIAPIGYRGVLEFVLLDFLGGYEFDFTLHSDRDYAGFEVVQQCVTTIAGGQLSLRLDDGTGTDTSRVLNRLLHPMHVRLANWRKLIGKAIRLQVTWTGSKQTMAFAGIEFERSLEPHAQAKVQTPPTPGGTAVVLFGEEDGESGSSPEPHAPPDPPGIQPVDVEIIATASWSQDAVALTEVDSTPVPGDNMSQVFSNNSWTNGSENSHGLAIVSADGQNAWFVAYDNRRLVHYDISTPGSAVKSYEYDLDTDADYTGSPAVRGCQAAFYSDASQRLYLGYSHFGGTATDPNSILIYDVSTPTSTPTLLLAQATTFAQRLQGMEMTSDELVLFVGCHPDFGSGATDGLAAWTVNASGTAITPLGTVNPFTPDGNSTDGMHLRRVTDDLLLMTAQLDTHRQLVAIDISSPGSMAVRDRLTYPTSGMIPSGIAIKSDNSRAYVKLRRDAGNNDQAVSIVDITDPDNLTEVTQFSLTGSVAGYASGEAVHYVEDSEGSYLLVSGDTELQAWDVSDEGAITSIELSGTATNDSWGLGCPRGPHTYRSADEGGEPTPLSANIAVAVFAMGLKGQAAIIGVDDYAAPTFQGTVQHSLLRQPSAVFADDGDHFYILGSATGTLKVYAMGAGLSEVGTLTDSRLVGCVGLQRKTDGTALWTQNRDSIVEINVSTPTAPSVTSETALGPAHLLDISRNPVGLVGKTSSDLVTNDRSVGFASQTTKSIRGYTMPSALFGPKYAVMDATYAYFWNEYNGGGLAIVDHTDATMPVVGYLEVGGLGLLQQILLESNHVYVLDNQGRLRVINVTTKTAPTLAASQTHSGATDMAIRSSSELVMCGRGGGSSFTVRRIDISTPSAPSTTASLADSSVLSRIGVVNGKAVAVDSGGTARSYSLGAPPAEEDTVSVGAGALWKAFGFQDSGDFVAFLIDKSSALSEIVIIDVGTVTAIAIEGRVDTQGKARAWAMDIANGKAIHSDLQTPAGIYSNDDLWTMDLSTPSAPAQSGQLQDEEIKGAYGLALLGNKAMVGRNLGLGGVVEVDVTTIGSPALGDSPFPYTWVAPGLEPLIVPSRDGTKVLAVAGYPTFRIFEINTSGPRVGSFTEISASLHEVSAAALSDDKTRLYVCHRLFDLASADPWVIDVYDVTNVGSIPASLGQYTGLKVKGFGQFDNERAIDMKVTGTTQQVMIFGMGQLLVPRFLVVDFTTPGSPTLTGEVLIGGTIVHPTAGVSLEIY